MCAATATTATIATASMTPTERESQVDVCVDPALGRSVTNALQVHFQDRTSTSKVEVEYPLGHRRRRLECFPALEKKLMVGGCRVNPGLKP